MEAILQLQTMDFSELGVLLIIGGTIIIGMIIFFSKSVRYFRPSELIAISKPKEDTGLVNEKGEVIYSYYSYQQGGRVYIPFWKEYYVLPIYIISTNIKTGKLLMKDKLHISANIAIQYSIDVSTEGKRIQAFSRYGEFARYKNKTTQNDIADILDEYIKPIVLGIVPKIIGQIKLDDIIENRKGASLQLQETIMNKIEDMGLKLELLEIVNIDILNEAYYKKLEKAIARDMELLDKDLQIKLAEKDNELDNVKANFKKEQYKREQGESAEKHKLDLKLIEMEADLRIQKINKNEAFQKVQKKAEDYNRDLILTEERAKKDAELILEHIELDIAKISNERQILENKTSAENIKSINDAMKDVNGYASFLIMLERNPKLIKQLFGKGGLSKFANVITKHIASVESINIADLGGDGKGGMGGAFERFAFMIPTLLSQTISKLNKVGIAQALTDIGVDKESINNLKKNRKIVEEFSELGEKVGIKNSKELVDEFLAKHDNEEEKEEKTEKTSSTNQKEDKEDEESETNEDSKDKEEKDDTVSKETMDEDNDDESKVSAIKKWFTKKDEKEDNKEEEKTENNDTKNQETPNKG